MIQTSTVFLRPFCEDDLFDLYEYASVEGVGESAAWKHHQSIEESKAVLYNVFLNQKGAYAIVNREKKKVIGSFAVRESTSLANDFLDDVVIELGYVLSKTYWNQGIMTELVASVIDNLKETSLCTVVVATTFTENLASMKVLEKNGFSHYKIEESYFPGLDQVRKMNCFYKRIRKHYDR